MAPPVFAIRTRPEAVELFDQLHEQMRRVMPFGKLTRGEAFEMLVSSVSAAVAKGELHLAAPAPPAAEPRPVHFRPPDAA